MNIITAILIILLFSIFITWLDNIGWKHKEELIDKAIDKASAFIGSKKEVAMGRDKVREIAESKMADLNAASVEAAMRMVEGTARSMGIVIED